MRAALLGACATDDAHLRRLIAASTRTTHRDPRAEDAARAVARAARAARHGAPSAAVIDRLAAASDTEPLRRSLDAVADCLDRGAHPAAHVGWEHGVSGYCVDTVPAALWAWGAHRGDPAAAIEAAVRLGGDTDSVAAIAGALAGAEDGAAALPGAWLQQLRDWPLTRAHLDALAGALCGGPLPRDRTLLALPRNLVAGVALGVHALRRLAW